jgi:hypothetical protein
VSGVGPPVPVSEEAALHEPVVVGPLAILDWRRGGDGQGNLGQDGRLEDALRPNQRHALALEVEAAFQDGAGDGRFAEAAAPLAQKAEGAQADHGVAVGTHGRRCAERLS